MAWYDDIGDGIMLPIDWVSNKASKIDRGVNNLLDGGNNILDIFSGNSNILIYLGIGIVAVAVLPTLIEKFA